MASYLRKPVDSDGEGPLLNLVDESEWAEAHPALTEYLTATRYADGTQREPASCIVFVEGGRWKACLNDKDTQQTGWCSAGAFEELWDTLECALAAGTLDWRRSRLQGGGGRGKKQ